VAMSGHAEKTLDRLQADAAAAEIRAQFDMLSDVISTLPPGARRATALTQLEGACMWAVKAAYKGDGD